ncbi:MAG: flavodoxin domain-containing protein, partial [Vallitaleaceae bacterium]|nr:flavodoxin domain-containing protein [Vallitaleaceae bacterium]
MKSISIIYWTGTGNTELMAEAISDGAKNAGAQVKLIEVSSASLEDFNNADVVAFGCPSMGNEELEESEMEPYISSIEGYAENKKLFLFGSFGWG